MSELTEDQKDALLDAAKGEAKVICDEWENTGPRAAMLMAMDDIADDREYYSGFGGDREVVYDFLKSKEDEIRPE